MSNEIKIIIVEDVDEIREGIMYLINSSDGFNCIAAFNSAENLISALPQLKPDIILMDIGLPGMTGIECTRIIKESHPQIKIMIFTVFEDDDRLFEALKTGANGYILKKTPPGKLIDAFKDMHMGGAPMSLQISRRVVEYFRDGKKMIKSGADSEFNLSKRELEILELMSSGFRNKEIAEKLFISAHTVRSHIYNIYEKLHVQNRVEALNKISSGR